MKDVQKRGIPKALAALLLLGLAASAQAQVTTVIPAVPPPPALPAELPDIIVRPEAVSPGLPPVGLAYYGNSVRLIAVDGSGDYFVVDAAGPTFGWRRSTGERVSYAPPPPPPDADLLSWFVQPVVALSGTGTSIAGTAGGGVLGTWNRAFRTGADGEPVTLAVPTGTTFGSTSAAGISADGSVVVGASMDPVTLVARPTRWTPAGIEVLDGGRGTATAADADGDVVVGQLLDAGTSATAPFRWTPDSGLVLLPGLPGLAPTAALAVSLDGEAVLGIGASAGTSRALLWRGAEVLDLGELLGPVTGAVSADGSLVVMGREAIFIGPLGDSVIELPSTAPFVWTESGGPQSLLDYLVARGATGLEGWSLLTLNAVSADARWVAGVARAPNGAEAFYVADLTAVPLPAGGALLFAAVASLGLRARGRRRRQPPPTPPASSSATAPGTAR